MARFCHVYLADAARAIDQAWTYAIPASLAEDVVCGSAVRVRFGRRKRPERAYVTHVFNDPPDDIDLRQIKPLEGLAAPRPVLTDEQIRLAFEMKRRWYCTMGDAIQIMVPPTVMKVGDRALKAARLVDREAALAWLDAGEGTTMKQVRVVELLLEHASAPCVEIQQAADVSASVLNTLAKRNVIEFFRLPVARPLPEEATSASPEPPPALTAPQQAAVEAIDRSSRGLAPPSLEEHLLFGVTGSGKTEVYLRAAERFLDRGRQVLILVPEIALTPQMTRRLTARFGDRVAILHSRLTPAGRYETWQRVLRQEMPIVVGARSAVFAPLENIGMIVVDEEQESSYKSEQRPRYDALDVARMRAMMHGAVLVLGSATPQVESFYRTKIGKSSLLRLPDRIGDVGLPDVEIVDMRREYAAGHMSVFSRRLETLFERTLEYGEQAMILLNRRGFSRTVVCRACGWQMTCPSCDIALTSHVNPYGARRDPTRMVCHLCDRVLPVPDVCPECGQDDIAAIGVGTQQVEEALTALYPEARVLRMDQDTTRGRFSHRDILDAFERGDADFLVGTQMIAKGHDFPNVTLSAILLADQLYATGEYRSTEQAFQLMTQAAGRSGRGTKKGRVIIQAVKPDHFIVQTAARQDYEQFYAEEIAFRERMGYVPFGHIGLAEFRGLNARDVEAAAEAFRDVACAVTARHRDLYRDTVISHVAPSPIARIRNRYRFRVIVREPDREPLTRLMFYAADHAKRADRVSIVVDIDPRSTL